MINGLKNGGRAPAVGRLRTGAAGASFESDAHRSERHAHHAGGEALGTSERVVPSQAALVQPGRPPDVFSPRDKSSGKGKKTADKWNQ